MCGYIFRILSPSLPLYLCVILLMSHCRLGIFIFTLLVSLNAENVLSIFLNSNGNSKKHGRIMKRERLQKQKQTREQTVSTHTLLVILVQYVQTYIFYTHTPHTFGILYMSAARMCVCVGVRYDRIFGLNILIGIFIKLTRPSYHIGSYRCSMFTSTRFHAKHRAFLLMYNVPLMSFSIRTVNL